LFLQTHEGSGLDRVVVSLRSTPREDGFWRSQNPSFVWIVSLCLQRRTLRVRRLREEWSGATARSSSICYEQGQPLIFFAKTSNIIYAVVEAARKLSVIIVILILYRKYKVWDGQEIMTETRDVEFLEYVVKELVDKPEAVKVARKVDEMGVLITLDVDSADMGKIIGKSGNTAKAIRTLLRVVGMKNNSRVNLKINEPEGGTRPVAFDVLAKDDSNNIADNSDDASSVDDAIEDLKSM